MTTNQYFRSNFNASTKDQKLVENLTIEDIKNRGIDIYYVPRSTVNEDDLFGEDRFGSFGSAYEVEVYLVSIDGWGGDNDFLSKFGLEIRDEVTFSVARKRFDEEITANDSAISRPQEGDLLYLPVEIDKRERLFEITFVEEEEIFYQLGNLYTYEMRCKVFEFGGEDFDTGISGIDSIEDYASQIEFVLDSGTGDFTVGEDVFQGTSLAAATFSAEVVSWDSGTKKLVVKEMVGEHDINSNVEGNTSGADWSISSIDDTANLDMEDNDTFSDASEIVDFTVTNPFSE